MTLDFRFVSSIATDLFTYGAVILTRGLTWETPKWHSLTTSINQSLFSFVIEARARAMTSLLSEDDWKNIEISLNLLELAPVLTERNLMPLGALVSTTDTYRSEFLREIRRNKDKFVAFSSCFDDEERYEHLGHDYVACLLHKRPYSTKRLIKLSSYYEAAIQANMTKVVQWISLKELKTHFLEKRLLTSDEMYSFTSCNKKDIFRLFEILRSKGPTAYALFVDCLHDEREHRGHRELHSLLTRHQTPPSPKPTKPRALSCGKELCSEEYHERRHKFERYYHSGQWSECEKLANECMASGIIEIQVIGHLELALSYVFRVEEQHVLYHVREAEMLCAQIENFNRTFLLGRCKYLQALLYHYKAEYVLARQFIVEAKDILFAVEVGEDKSFAVYCDAIISATSLTENSSGYEFQEVIKKFETSLSYSSSTYDMDILSVYSYLRLGRLYLGRTETNLSICKDKDHIQSSRDCQLKLKVDYYTEMDDRCKALYHLNEYDILMIIGEHSSARDQLQMAKQYVKRSKCSMDEMAVQARLTEISDIIQSVS